MSCKIIFCIPSSLTTAWVGLKGGLMTGGTKATKPCFIYHAKPAVLRNMGLAEADNNERKCIVIK